MHIKFNNGPILNFIKFLKQQILFYSDGLAIWHGFPDIMHIKLIMAASQPL